MRLLRLAPLGIALGLVSGVPALAGTVTLTGTIVRIDADTGGGTYAGTSLGDTFTATFVVGDTEGDAVFIESEPGEKYWTFPEGAYSGSVTDGVTQTDCPGAEVDIENDGSLDGDSAKFVSGLLGRKVSRGTSIDLWAASCLTPGAFFADDDELYGGMSIEILYASFDTSTIVGLDYIPSPPELANVDLAFITIDEADELGNRLFSAIALAALPVDNDGDGVEDQDDNCPNIANADQADDDGNGVGDVCDFPDSGDVDDAAEDFHEAVQNTIADACPQKGDGGGQGGLPQIDCGKATEKIFAKLEKDLLGVPKKSAKSPINGILVFGKVAKTTEKADAKLGLNLRDRFFVQFNDVASLAEDHVSGLLNAAEAILGQIGGAVPEKTTAKLRDKLELARLGLVLLEETDARSADFYKILKKIKADKVLQGVEKLRDKLK